MEFATYHPHRDRPAIKAIWSDLYDPNRHSYFMSWGWIETWLDLIPANTRLSLLAAYRSDRPLIAFFLGGPRWARRPLLPLPSLALNNTGNAQIDRLSLEYNCILHSLDGAPSLPELLRSLPFSWARISLTALDARLFPGSALADLGRKYISTVVREEPSYYVDLRKIRESGCDYLSQLKSDTRYQLKKAKRYYEKRGPLLILEPTNSHQALAFYSEMVELNRRLWSERGQTSAFDSEFFRRFHRELISRRFPEGEIQILKVMCGGETVGVLYNLKSNADIYFYQSGFLYGQQKSAQPGLVTHLLAIEHCIENGYSCYDFLGGDAQYKRAFSNGYHMLKTVDILNGEDILGSLNRIERASRDILFYLAGTRRSQPASEAVRVRHS